MSVLPLSAVLDHVGTEETDIDGRGAYLVDVVCYRVPDVDAAHAALLAAGCTELRAPFDLTPAKARSSLVREPSGARLQLIAYAPDSPDLT